MDEDTEVLDWGHEEDDYQSYDTRRSHENICEPRHHAGEDCDDTVSLGGDEDDLGVVYAYQSRSYQEKPKSSEITRHHNRDHYRESSQSSARQPSHLSPSHSSHQHAKLTHALPAKPVIVNPSVAVAQSQLLEASSMVNGRDRDRRNSIKKPAGEPLPPDWEIRHPRSGGSEVYYYNVKTHESTWVRPTLPPQKGSRERNERANGTSHQSTGGSRARSPSNNYVSPPKNRTTLLPSEDMSFDDRHYRPMEVPASSGRVEHILPQKPVFADRRSPERLSPAEGNRRVHRSQAESERARSRRGVSPSNARPPSPEDRRQEAGREPRSRPSRMDSYIPPTDRNHTSTHDERDTVRPSANSTLLASISLAPHRLLVCFACDVQLPYHLSCGRNLLCGELCTSLLVSFPCLPSKIPLPSTFCV
ncbi:hypothetical protein BDM02DRAFT_1660518 [Thelephora ganbajun]|uniref:Uncharacterized protein n=1 Tax=Thelephora ganbajun TaxID=370292 RepID=A0ACB6ZWF4_THEGA|nr:hypothetical protein BDM02DRAFT_1660518 [Thelephora ganbajun]